MEILRVKDNIVYFVIGDKEVTVENFSGDDLLNLLDLIYENETDVNFPSVDIIENIKNPVEREVIAHINSKLKDFHGNISQIKNDIEYRFPSIDREE